MTRDCAWDRPSIRGAFLNSFLRTMTRLHGPDFLQRAAAARRQIREIDAAGLKALMADGGYLIDVREAEEFEAGHIWGARHMSASSLPKQAPLILEDRTHPVAVICSRGNRSAIAALELQALGYSSVVSLKGGLRDWPEALVRSPAYGP